MISNFGWDMMPKMPPELWAMVLGSARELGGDVGGGAWKEIGLTLAIVAPLSGALLWVTSVKSDIQVASTEMRSIARDVEVVSHRIDGMSERLRRLEIRLGDHAIQRGDLIKP